MLLVHLLQNVLNTWTVADILTGGCDETTCPGSSFYAITAALATQGYYMQAQIVSALAYGNQGFAVFVYVCAAIAGIVSMALGMPPKLYLWFFMGPALFHFLLGTDREVKGVAWSVGNMIQDQNEVWRLAEAGLANVTVNEKIEVDWLGSLINTFATGKFQISFNKSVTVPWFFVYMDYLVSDLVQQMTSWFGFFSQSDDPIFGSVGETGDPDYWYLLSSLKWEVMESVTAATLSSPDLRDAFVTFLSSECGDELKKSINGANYAKAATATGSRSGVPDTVFHGVTLGNPSSYRFVIDQLNHSSVPMPDSVRRFVRNGRAPSAVVDGKETTGGIASDSFLNFTKVNGEDSKPPYGTGTSGETGGGWERRVDGKKEGSTEAGMFKCTDYMETVIHGFRWEAAHIYNQILKSLPKRPGTDEDEISFSGQDLGRTLFTGWVFADRKSDGGLEGFKPIEGSSADFYPNLLMDLILVHLFRNEMVAAPRLAEASSNKTSAQKQKTYVEMNLKTVGQKGKAGEFYVWAKMVPYLQGVLLYCLAIAYPFVCILVLIPGWHKILFTWLSFWVWVKLWDLGFAVVVLLERSVWASFGGGSDSAYWWAPIIEMQNLGKIDIKPVERGIEITSILGGSGNKALVTETLQSALAIFDHALCSMNLALDLNNAYYIYIMTGLYLAVPAVIGQCVLGAKAGVASLATGIIQPVTEAGKAAASGWQGEKNAHLAANSGSIGQAAYGKALRKNGLALQALGAQNRGFELGVISQADGMHVQGIGNQSKIYGLARGVSDANLQVQKGLYNEALNPFAWIPIKALASASGQGDFDRTIGQLQSGEAARSAMGNGGGGTSQPPRTGNSGAGGGAPGRGLQYQFNNPAFSHGTRGGNQAGAGAGAGGGGAAPPSGADFSTGNVGGAAPPSGADFGAGKAGVGVNPFWDFAQGGMAAIHPFMTAVSTMTDAAGSIVGRDIAQRFNGIDQQLTGRQSDFALDQFRAGANQSRVQLSGSRAGEAAGFAGESAVWAAKNAIASSASGELAAMGLNSGTLAPGPKPQGLAMASYGGEHGGGLLGSQARTFWDYAGSDEAKGFINTQYDAGVKAYGSARLSDIYHSDGTIVSTNKAGTGIWNAMTGFAQAASAVRPDGTRNGPAVTEVLRGDGTYSVVSGGIGGGTIKGAQPIMPEQDGTTKGSATKGALSQPLDTRKGQNYSGY